MFRHLSIAQASIVQTLVNTNAQRSAHCEAISAHNIKKERKVWVTQLLEVWYTWSFLLEKRHSANYRRRSARVTNRNYDSILTRLPTNVNLSYIRVVVATRTTFDLRWPARGRVVCDQCVSCVVYLTTFAVLLKDELPFRRGETIYQVLYVNVVSPWMRMAIGMGVGVKQSNNSWGTIHIFFELFSQ